jgi:glutamate dehydrogenase (NAD(P)+)
MLDRAFESSITHQEPTPITDRQNPFESMMKRFDVAAEILELEPGVYEY